MFFAEVNSLSVCNCVNNRVERIALFRNYFQAAVLAPLKMNSARKELFTWISFKIFD